MAEYIEQSYDILEWFPILFCQKVFRYLEGKDVIEASVVNKEWYTFTAESQQMAKLKLVFKGTENLTEEAIKILKCSQRRYQNIHFEQVMFKDSDFFATFLAERAGSWKSVTFKDVHIYNEDLIYRIFQTIKHSVEELELYQVTHRTIHAKCGTYARKRRLTRQKNNQACLELMLTGMPRLSSLTFAFEQMGTSILLWASAFPLNTTITALEIISDMKHQSSFENFIRALRNLKHFKCERMNDEQFHFLAREVPALESIEVATFGVSCFLEGKIFPNFKKFTAGWLDRNLQEPTGDGNFAVVVREAMRAFFSNN